MLLFKRFISALLVVVMLFGMVPPISVSADETETAVTEVSVPETTEAVPETTAVIPESSEAVPEAEEAEEKEPETQEPQQETESVLETEGAMASQETVEQEEEPVFNSSDLVKLEIQTLPDKIMYQAGDPIDLTGITLYAEDSQGLSQTVGAEDITIASGDASAVGKHVITVSYGNLTASYEIQVHTLYNVGEILQDSADYPESDHNYACSIDISYTYSCENAEYLKLTFSTSTFVENNYDKIYLYDGSDNLLGTYTGSALAGVTVTVPDDFVRIRLTTDGSVTKYGFSLTSIYAYMNQVAHEPADEGVYTEPLCFEDGYTTHTCWICDETFIEEDPDSAAHIFTEGFCQICGLPENQISCGIITDSIVWAITEDNTLYISGTGDMPDNIVWDGDISAATALIVGEGITRLGNQAFYGKSALQTVSLPTTLTAIGSSAFYGCSGLTEIALPDGLESIGSNAFRGCSALTNIYIPASVSTITAGSYSASPFYSCSSDLVIYCAAPERQSGWQDCWNYRASGSPLTTNYGYTAGEYAYWVGFDNTSETIVIEEGITVIPSKAFYNCTSLTSITLPASLTTIGDYAFYGCSALTEILIPDTVTTIGSYAFANCTGLTSLTLPASLTSLGVRFLSGTSGVTAIAFPAGLTSCGFDSSNGVLTGSSVAAVSFASGMTAIPDYILYNISTVTSVTIPDSVTAIGSYAFYQCSKLASVELSENLTAIGSYAFYKCTSLTEVAIPDGVTQIGDYTFNQCTKLATVTLPANLTDIGMRAFYGCSALTAMTIPDSVAIVGPYAFYNCSKMAMTALPASLTEIGEYAFYNCAALTAEAFPEGVTTIGGYVFSGCTGLTKAEFANLENLGHYVFNGCTALTSVTLPDTLTALGYSVFYGCSALTELRLPASITAITSSGNRGPLDGSGITKVIFADGFTSIPNYILSYYASSGTYASKIAEVVFEAPEKITSIGNNAFCNCVALADIEIPSGITTIPAYAFQGCKSLESVSLPDGLKTIGEYAFQNCSALTEITLPEGLTTLGYSAFYGCFALTELRLPASLTTMSSSGNRGPLDGSGITKVIFADGFTNIPAHALSNYAAGTTGTYSSRIAEVVFEAPEKITYIGSYAFYNCAALTSIVIPEAVTILYNDLFRGCSSLETVTMPDALIAIGSNVFYNCAALKNAEIPETVISIDTYAFYGCTALEEVAIPADCTVYSYAFSNCSGLRELAIGDNAVINSYAFSNCSGLNSVSIGSNVTLYENAFNNVVLSGTCGENMTWSLNLGTGTMTLDGSGEMTDYSLENPAPWYGFASLIKAITYGSSVTDIGAYAFVNCSGLQAMILPLTIKTISENSFYNCENICYVEIPDGIQYIGENAFDGCDALEEVVFLGDAPVMEDNCFGDSSANVYYPETASGFIARIFEKFVQYIWEKWDDTVPSKDVVILLDTSGSMGGKEGTLSSASTQLIKSIGGAIRKTNIAVVEYESSATTLNNFTTNTYQLVDSVSSLYASGGTNYSNALNRADSLLNGRNSDIKFVIMFSDGQPGDSTTTINNIAAAMREKGIVIYTVGLGTNSNQRQVLINVADSESRYFEASNIAGLIAAFQELSENFGKSEYATVEMKINDVRHDLFNEAYSLCLASDTLISFYLTPGTNEMYDNVASIALEQDGRYVLMNDTGIFENIRPGDYFQSGKPVYMVMLDADGNVIERKQLLLNFTDNFKVTYVLGDLMDNAIYLEETFIPGNDFTEPAEPESQGYIFRGWYASENCEGTEFFAPLNYYNRLAVEGNLTLYAKWEEDAGSFILGTDTWGFRNTNSGVFSATHYEMTVGDQEKLMKDLGHSDKTLIDAKRFPKNEQGKNVWKGSCFGMATSALLIKADQFQISPFDSRFDNPGESVMYVNSGGDSDVGNIESMINYYHIRQSFGDLMVARADYDTSDESSNIKNVVDTLISEGTPVVFTISLNEDGEVKGGHALVAFDLEQTETGYTFQIYDCALASDRYYTVDVTVSNGVYTASYPDWLARWSRSGYDQIFIKATLTVKDLMSMPLLTAPSVLSSAVSSVSSGSTGYNLITSYGDFTISSSIGAAVIEDGYVVSGDLAITCFGQTNEAGYGEEYEFLIPGLADGDAYTITKSVDGLMNTTFYNSHSANGFFASQTANASGTVVLHADKSIQTHYDTSVEQSIRVSLNSMTTPWYSVMVTGTGTGFTVTPTADIVSVVSETETTVNIEAKSDFNNVTLTNVPVGTSAAEVKESENNDCIVEKDNEIIASSAYGYSVVFNSCMGTSVEAQLNLPYGSLVEEPTDPTRVGYIFQGWFKDEEYSEIWDFDADTVTQNTILYAGWSINPNYLQSVTFQVPGQDPQIVYIPKGDLIPLSYAPLGNDGEDLIWYTNAAYTSEEWDFENDTVTGDITLYGKTTLCTISYVTNNGQSLADSKIYTGMVIPQPTGLVLEGYTLCGWYTDAEFVNAWDFVNDTVSENVTLYAKWLPNEFDKEGSDTGICIEILNEDGYTYTGKAIKPEIVVRDDGNVLTLGKDYTVAYKNNTNARAKDDTSVKASKLPQIIIQGKGNYKSAKKITRYFTIQQAEMKSLQVSLPAYVTAKAGDKLQTVKATVSTGLVKVAASNYTIQYYTDAELTAPVKGITAPGVYYVTLEAKLDKNGNYSGNFRGVTDAFAIQVAPAAQMLSSAKITLPKTITAAAEQPEENAAIQALISRVTLNKVNYLTDDANIDTFKELFVVTAKDTNGTEVSQADLGTILMSVGKKTLTVSAREGNSLGLMGEKTATVTVKGTALNKKQFQVTFDKTGENTVIKSQYSGISQVPAVLSQLEAGKDYTVSYKSGKNTVSSWQVKNAGNYSLVITGKGAYSGTLTYSFSITKVDIAKAYAAGNIKITSPGKAVYSPTGAKLSLSVSYINERGTRVAMAEGRDYTLSYSGNKTVTENAAMTLKGKGNFSGSLSKTKAPELIYSVTKKPIGGSDVTVTVNGVTVKNGEISGVKYTVYHAGKKVATSQYTGELTPNDDDTVTLKIIAREKLYTGTRSLVIKKDLIKATDTKKVKITLPKENRYYSGSSIRPEVTITDAEGKDISGCFTITYGENTKVGSGSITVTGRPDMGYYGAKTLKFTILPKWAKWIFG